MTKRDLCLLTNDCQLHDTVIFRFGGTFTFRLNGHMLCHGGRVFLLFCVSSLGGLWYTLVKGISTTIPASNTKLPCQNTSVTGSSFLILDTECFIMFVRG